MIAVMLIPQMATRFWNLTTVDVKRTINEKLSNYGSVRFPLEGHSRRSAAANNAADRNVNGKGLAGEALVIRTRVSAKGFT